MKKLKRLLVGPLEYRVGVHPLGEAFGQTDHFRLRIDIDEGLPITQERITVLHETLHAVFDFTGVADRLGKKKAEDVINSVDAALLDVFRRNPALVEYLIAE